MLTEHEQELIRNWARKNRKTFEEIEVDPNFSDMEIAYIVWETFAEHLSGCVCCTTHHMTEEEKKEREQMVKGLKRIADITALADEFPYKYGAEAEALDEEIQVLIKQEYAKPKEF